MRRSGGFSMTRPEARSPIARWIAIVTVWLGIAQVHTQQTVRHPFQGVTHITRAETSPRNVRMHILMVDLTAPGISVTVTPPGGPQETIRQTTLQFLEEE